MNGLGAELSYLISCTRSESALPNSSTNVAVPSLFPADPPFGRHHPLLGHADREIRPWRSIVPHGLGGGIQCPTPWTTPLNPVGHRLDLMFG